MIIVTGGAGLIGSAMVWKLNSLGRDDIVVVDHLGTGNKWKNLVPLRFMDYIEKDAFIDYVRNRNLPYSGRIDAIIHLGACSSTTERDASYLAGNNFEYSKQLALFALEQGARFIYASSAATYGNGDCGFSDEDTTIDRLRPINAYGYSKQLFDLWLLRKGLLDKVVGLKYFNVYGPNEYHKGEMRSLVLKAFEQIISSGEMALFRSHRPDYADGEQVRDFVYVKDAVDMTLFFLERPEINGLFNIGGGKAFSWNSLAAAIFAALEKPAKIRYVDMPEQIRNSYQYYTCADVTKLRNAGYGEQATPLEDAVRDYVTNYLVSGKNLDDCCC